MPVKEGRYVDRNLIRRIGWNFSWRMAVLCPNLRADGQHDYACEDCRTGGDGRGYIYSSSVNKKGIFHGDSRDEPFDVAGAWEKGTASLTFSAHERIGNRDKIIILSHPIRDSLVLTRGATALDKVRSPNLTEILYIRDGATEYNLNLDYSLQVDSDGTSYIKWAEGGNQPSLDERYSAAFLLNPTWVVDGHPKARAFGARKRDKLPHVVTLKRDDLAVRE